jgi:DNA helicase HerA-like ATPase
MAESAVWEVVQGIPACRLVEVPRRAATESEAAAGRDDWRDQRLAALVSAYHAGTGSIAIGWRRAEAAGPVEVYVGGHALIGEAGDGGVVLSLPAGGRGLPIPDGALAEAMAGLPFWSRISGITDGLLIDSDDTDAAGSVRPSLEDCLLSVWTQPFAWLLVVEPIGAEEVDAIADEISERAYRAQSMADRSPENAVEAVRQERRHRELRQGATSGLWRVHLLTGGGTPQAATRIAALMCASADLEGLPYALAPEPADTGLQAACTNKTTSTAAASWPIVASSELVAALARPPVREVPGVRLVVRPDFDVTPEIDPGATPGVGLGLGWVLDRNRSQVGVLSVPLSSLNRHTFVCGATGAGKSQTIRGLLERATGAGVPWLVVEPAKAEYRLMAARLPHAEVVTVRPGQVDGIPAGINPLEPARDAEGRAFPLQTHADLVRALFLAAFESDEPFPQVLSAALTRCYEQLGWDLALGEPAVRGTTPPYPTLGDLQAAAEQVVTEIGYGKEITDNVRGFIKVRLSSLRLGTTGRFFEGGHPIDFDQLLRRNVVLEIEDVGDDRDKAFLMGTVLVRLVEHLRMRHRHTGGGTITSLRHLSVFEEAHRLLRRTGETGPAAHAVEMFAGLLAEIRAYGEGLIVAEQIPSKLVPDVIKNTAVKIVHRLPARDDRDAVGATMNITDNQSSFLVTLPPGEGAVFTDGMDYPHLVRMPDGTEAENARPAETASPAVLVTPRSTTCGRECLASPCTLRDMRTAQHAVDDHPAIRLWAELTTAAHLTGWTTPIPADPLLDVLRDMPARQAECALSHAVDAAVAARASIIARRGDPGRLAGHLVSVLRGQLDGQDACSGAEPEWFAAPFQWCLVLEELQRSRQAAANGSRHPHSAEWERTYGRAIPGETLAEQHQHVSRWWDRDQRDKTACDIVLWGTGSPSAIETAAAARHTDEDWNQRLRDAAVDLGDVDGLLQSFMTDRPGVPDNGL